MVGGEREVNEVLRRKKFGKNPMQEEIDRVNREEHRDRANLAMTRDLFGVWKAVIANPEAYRLTERKAEDLEDLLQKSAELEAGAGSRVELDRGFGSCRLFGPGGDWIDL
jgi:hypothetical protein